MNRAVPLLLKAVQAEFGSAVYPESFIFYEGASFWLEKAADEKRLAIAAPPDSPVLTTFNGKQEPFKAGIAIKRCPLTAENGAALRAALPWLKPGLLGLRASAGFGDRLGLATPGHARAVQAMQCGKVAPIFAQQSIREMERTGRTPEDVMNDATWGAFQAGWQSKVGADADHLKTTADIDRCAAAGFTFFTIDPGAYVDNEADDAEPNTISEKCAVLPWRELECDEQDIVERYAGKKFDLEPSVAFGNSSLIIEKEDVLRAAVKYGRAVAHVVKLARHLIAKGIQHELEISVDETEAPTSFAEHIYVAGELKRLGVKWVSLAPRYVGRFEKGIDYIGDLDLVERHLAGHAAIARAMGPYKLSLHSGSDKFSIYPLMKQACGALVHLKTAGTSYVEALRVIAAIEPEFFREVYKFAIERYPEDKATYHVSAEPTRMPNIESQPPARFAELLDDLDARQVLHVTFGSVLKWRGKELLSALRANEELHYEILERHFIKHLELMA